MDESTVSVEESGKGISARLEGRLELVAAILLGLAAMATAWSAYQSSQYGGKVLENFTQANLDVSNSNGYYSDGDQVYLQDQILFVEYEKARNSGDDQLATYLHDSLMDDHLIAAVDWWEQP